jgi:RimJ/RimL family protein N-acetyltransferase
MNPILLEFPEEFETERLFIRKPLPGDGRAVYEAVQASLNELKRWMPWAHKTQTVVDMEANMRDAHAKFLTREDLRLHLYKKDTGEFIGSSGLHRIKWEIPRFEIGYWIETPHQDKWYMTEATEAITNFAFKELNAKRVEIRCDYNNIRSKAIPERLGFTLDGILKNYAISADGKERVDECVYSKTIN